MRFIVFIYLLYSKADVLFTLSALICKHIINRNLVLLRQDGMQSTDHYRISFVMRADNHLVIR
jgi:hypothetical protein